MEPVLQGMRVLAVEQYGAGPFGTQMLADLGAEVIKIEDHRSGGDSARAVGPHFERRLPETAQSIFFQGLNRNKKSIALDITSPAGRAVLERLVADADAVADNLRGDVPARLGLTYAQLAAINPRIVCAHLSGYGREGERARWPGYDYLMQGETGYFHLTGEPGSAPSRMGQSVIDLAAGVMMGLGLVGAVMKARETGRGRDVDVSLFDTALFNLNYIGNWYLNARAATTRLPRSAHPSLTPCQTYRTRDGWIYLMCNKEKFWGELCACIGRLEWATDARFLGFPDRLQHRDLITTLLDEALSVRTTAEWMVIFAGKVPAAPIYDIATALQNPFVTETDRIDRIAIGDGGRLDLVAQPIRTGSRQSSRASPALGADTDEILSAAGLSGEEIARLRKDGVIG